MRIVYARAHMLSPLLFTLLAVSAAAPTPTPAPVVSAEPAVGKAAPDFTLTDNDGKPWTLSERKGQTVVIVFYPKAYTGG
jgi:cytochrome oxidase Cu insertion factor (SCO1/SenC/PrrC family)